MSPTVLESLNLALHRLMQTDERVILLGEDVLDPYGGAFRVTRGLSSAFPNRVLSTPISEAGITGIAAGVALRGLRPVVEIMFGDFLTLAADQLVNHASKFRWMYNDQVEVPMLLRTPMGGRRGYGPTHSQSLEKLFLGVPGLEVLAPAPIGDPGELLYQAVRAGKGPTLFIENKLLYLLPVNGEGWQSELEIEETGSPPAYTCRLRGAPPAQLTLAAYGYMADLARQAVTRLAYEREVFADLIVLTRLSPFDLEAVTASAAQTSRLLTVEEGSYSLGWGAEVLARTLETLGPRLKAARRAAATETPIPASVTLEQAALPGVEQIMQAALDLILI